MGRHLRALLGADALCPLGPQGAHEPQDPRCKDNRQHNRDDERREHDVAGGAEGAGRLEEHKTRSDHERDSDARPRDDGRPGADR